MIDPESASVDITVEITLRNRVTERYTTEAVHRLPGEPMTKYRERVNEMLMLLGVR